MIVEIIRVGLRFLRKLPIYPNWLEHLLGSQNQKSLLSYAHGLVLETGSGSGYGANVVQTHYGPQIQAYIATDFNKWDEVFENLPWYHKLFSPSQRNLNALCDGTFLPFKSNSVDTYISLETLEHLKNPSAFIAEASRVLKTKGVFLLSIPFLYEIHGTLNEMGDLDYSRYTPHNLREMFKEQGFVLKKTIITAGAGAVIATTANSWLTKLVTQSGWKGLLLLPFAPLYFALFNLFGLLLDWVRLDKRFAQRIHALFVKSQH